MKIRHAFTIIEVLVYLALVIILFTILTHIVVGVRQSAVFVITNSERLIQRTISRDLIRRDVQAASINKDEWDKRHFVFIQYTVDKKGKIGRHSVGYECKDGILWRYHGHYDFDKHAWIKRVKSVVCKNVKTFEEIWQKEMPQQLLQS